MTLDECRDALEMAKLSLKADATAAQVRQLLDWAENIQQFLEIIHGPKETVEEPCGPCAGHGHVCEEEGPDQVWIACPNCKGLGKVQKPKERAAQAKERRLKEACTQCSGRGHFFEGDEVFDCSPCNGSGVEPPAP